MTRTLIRNAIVMTMDDTLGTMEGADVLIDGDRIAAVGRDLPADGAEVVDGTGRVVMPGLIDGHRHMFSGILRGGSSDVSYSGNAGGYFKVVIQDFGGSMTPEDSYVSSRLGAVESINGGITTLHAWEHNLMSPAHAEASLRAMRETGLRGRFSYGPPNDTMTLDQAGVRQMKAALFPHRDGAFWMTEDGLWSLGIATRGVELARPEIWEPEFAFARAEGLPITAHLMEGQIPALKAKDALGPDVLSIHALAASDEDIAYLKASGSPVCVATPALARSGHHPSPVVRLMKAGVPVCLSVDSTAGCDTADMWAVMRITMIVERLLHEDAGVYTNRDAIRHSTIEAARCLGIDHVTGSLTPGKKADVIVIDTRALNLAPFTVTETLIASCCTPANVEAVFIDGRCVKRDGRLVDIDPAAVVAEANAAFSGLQGRVGYRYS